MATAAQRAAAAKKPVAAVPDKPGEAPDGRQDSDSGEVGSDRRSPGRTGESGCRRCSCPRCQRVDLFQGKHNVLTAVLFALVFVLLLWNDFDIRRVARTVAQLGD